jgi:hypothetical protein
VPNVLTAAEPEAAVHETAVVKSTSKFPWWILVLAAAIAGIMYFLAKSRKKDAPAIQPAAEKAIVAPTIAAAPAVSEIVVDLEEEIRRRAYGLYELRYGQSEDRINDWHTARCEICAKYEADGYSTALTHGRWEAYKTITVQASD